MFKSPSNPKLSWTHVVRMTALGAWITFGAVTFALADSNWNTSVTNPTGTIITPDSPVLWGTRYGRVIRLQYSDSANGRLIATFESWPNDFRIYQSTDDGLTWTQIATTTETQFPGWHFKAEPDLLELPHQIGNLPAGTILLAGNSRNGKSTQHEIYYSLDHGVTWQYRGMVDNNNANTERGLWEPRLGITSDGRLICYYSDETHVPTYNQLLGERISSDGGITWGPEIFACAIPDGVQRPGMPVVTKLPNGQYVMSFESWADDTGQVRLKFSSDGINWGSGPSDYGIPVQTASGARLGATPYIMWSPAGGPDGVLIVSAQKLSYSPNTDRQFFINTSLGQGDWTMIPSAVQWQGGNLLSGWSQGMIPTADGQGVIQLASSAVSGNTGVNEMLVARAQLVLPGTTDSAPAITTQPVSRTVTAGSAVTFTVVASGSPAPTFQWKKGEAEISGATGASFGISVAAASDAGSYTVVVTNSAGSVTSNAATLTVNAAPPSTPPPSGGGGGGGGGAISPWFVAVLILLGLGRRHLRRDPRWPAFPRG